MCVIALMGPHLVQGTATNSGRDSTGAISASQGSHCLQVPYACEAHTASRALLSVARGTGCHAITRRLFVCGSCMWLFTLHCPHTRQSLYYCPCGLQGGQFRPVRLLRNAPENPRCRNKIS